MSLLFYIRRSFMNKYIEKYIQFFKNENYNISLIIKIIEIVYLF